jgi:transcriptional regulator with XRE-family HTH domain
MNILRIAREKKAQNSKTFSLNQFAQQLSVSPAHWSRIETNQKKPSAALIVKACELIKIDSDEILAEFDLLPPDIQEVLTSHRHRKLYYDLIRRLDNENWRTFKQMLELLDGGIL